MPHVRAASCWLALLLVAVIVPASTGAPHAEGQSCLALGKPVAERVLVAPRPKTFYAVDALNPDVIRWRGRYVLLFSGNAANLDAGDWYTGLADSRRPLGPFRVEPRVRLPFFNGGSTVWRNRLYTGVTLRASGQPALFESPDARHWHEIARMPVLSGPSWRARQSDLSLDWTPKRRRVYFAGRPGPSGADIGVASYLGGRRWGAFRIALRRQPGWDSFDLGEPTVFRWRGTQYMLYAGLGLDFRAREIGLAVETNSGWQRCGRGPLIQARPGSWYAANAIDPSPLVIGNRLYVYFGGGRRLSLGGNMNGTIGVRVYRLPGQSRTALR
ncbi:MAG: hypothetical protein WBB74_06550 [Gaiellaceae bacterium]